MATSVRPTRTLVTATLRVGTPEPVVHSCPGLTATSNQLKLLTQSRGYYQTKGKAKAGELVKAIKAMEKVIAIIRKHVAKVKLQAAAKAKAKAREPLTDALVVVRRIIG
eukprot:TRINITY_DN25706_c0_g1_i1.p3 TRINITY_DN25706_c0_g1~~TRINITY_DN25706_c0_g1_i1.p3  ORF type:complete len:109 (+),score=17.54 TRINITY_DN25706_c0_g1_i1:20-346(+)